MSVGTLHLGVRWLGRQQEASQVAGKELGAKGPPQEGLAPPPGQGVGLHLVVRAQGRPQTGLSATCALGWGWAWTSIADSSAT